ncbi:MAG: tetratricopeptide repeat protein, partial [Polyangiales bacterium]
MSDEPALPARYEPIRRLGAGGGGEVYEVRDRVDGRRLALKALAVADDGTSQHEIAALVREATTLMDLSASSGMALPRVERFGRLADGRPYLVREMVDGQSLAAFIEKKGSLVGAAKALQGAAMQLTQLHRAGLLHGDIKPANLIVRPDGSAALVDLGLATKWGPSGATPEGLTPRYAAPELMRGEPLTVRGEVYALGASLRDALAGCARQGASDALVDALVAIVARATAQEPTLRQPSVDEVGAAITAACGFPSETRGARGIWTIVGVDGPLATLARDVEELQPGGLLEVRGPIGAGGRTLMAALAWRLGISGWPVAWVRGAFVESALVLELATAIGMTHAVLDEAIAAFGEKRGLLVVEDLAGARAIVGRLRKAGAIVVARTFDDDPASGEDAFPVVPLDAREASELVRRALPSLPDAVPARVVLHGEGRPGRLRAIVDAIADRAIVRAESVDVIVASLVSAGHSAISASIADAVTVVSGSRAKKSGASIALARELLDAGRVTESEAALAGVKPTAQTHLLRGWIALAKGEYVSARSHVEALAREGLDAERDLPLLAERDVLLSKVCSRMGTYDQAVREADRALVRVAVEERAPAIAAEALQARGLARVYASDLDGALADFARSLELARAAKSKRVEALVHSSLAIAHQRSGKPAEARSAYRAAIEAAEQAGDASAVATSRLNLGTLCWHEGDLGSAISEFEAAADLGRRVQRQSTVERALINLGFVDLQLGRYARVASTLQSLEPLEAAMTPSSRAQLTGLRADLAGRTGDMSRAVELYRAAIAGWRATGRPQDAAEVTLDEVLMRRQRGSTLVIPSEDLRSIEGAAAELGPRAAELSVQIGLARGLCKLAAGDDQGALDELDRAATAADEQHANEWRWQVHAARARVHL